MKDLKYFEIELSNNNNIDRSSYGDDSDFTICIKAEREPKNFKEVEEFCCEDMKIYDLKYVVSIMEIFENEAYSNYNMDNIVKIFK